MSKDTAVVILSGSKDSVLAACLVAERGYYLLPVLCDNGHVDRLDSAQADVKSLQSKYGVDRVGDLVVLRTAETFYEYMHDSWCSHEGDLMRLYPGVQLYHVHCMSCKSSIFAGALSFCRQHDIRVLVDGARRSRGYCIDLDAMHKRLAEICKMYGVLLLTPVYHMDDDCDSYLAERGISCEEPKAGCFLGEMLKAPVDALRREKMSIFFDNELRKYIIESIRNGELVCQT